MAAKIRVAIAGASGVTGSSLVNGLLEVPGKFELTALARPASAGKPEYTKYAERGVIIKPVELKASSDPLVQALVGMDVVISCMTLLQLEEEMALIAAAYAAGVGRYVPSWFGPCCPPRGVMMAREMKEDILDHIKRLYLPYTAIDAGWWYQLSLPALPSGKFAIKAEYSTTKIIGDGNTPWAFTDNRDIGKYVARIIADPRTLNKTVFLHSEVHTQNEVWETLERVSGESVPREYVSKEDLLKTIMEGQAEVAKGNMDGTVMLSLGMSQYKYLLGIRGDNTPEHAKYLGYIDAKELYPDVIASPFQKHVEDVFYGRVKAVYS
ncbi:NmrA domain-containing protein [Fusarium keratoplasticum]|nr:NmrA domain-containing protein [Fusarium keratoplasticum]